MRGSAPRASAARKKPPEEWPSRALPDETRPSPVLAPSPPLPRVRSSKEPLRVALHRVTQSPARRLCEALEHAPPELLGALMLVGLRDRHRIMARRSPVVARAVRARRLVFVATERFARRLESPLRFPLPVQTRVGVAVTERLRGLTRRLLGVVDRRRRLLRQRPR